MALKYKLVAIPDGADDTESKAYATPGCKFNPVGVRCDPEDRHCEKCGHNPEVAASRLQKRFPGYKPPAVSVAPDGIPEPDGNG